MSRLNRLIAAMAAQAILAGGALAAPIGAQLLVQGWDPRHPTRNDLQVPYDHGSAVSDAVLAGWAEVRNLVCGPLKAHMGTADLLRKGVTLYDIECNLPDGELTAAQDGPKGLKLAYRVKRISFVATATQPTVCGRECDPRVSVTFDLALELGLALQEGGDTVRVTAAGLAVSNAEVDSHNAVADVLKWVDDVLVPIVRGASYRSQVERALNGVKADFAAKVNPKLAPVNQALRVPQGMVRIGLWARPGKLYAAVGPTEWMPAGNASVGGRVFWRSSIQTNQEIADCSRFGMRAEVQSGPAPLVDPVSRSFGIAPTRNVGQLVSGTPVMLAGELRQCEYRYGGLPDGIPLRLSAQAPASVAAAAGKQSNAFGALRLQPVGWNGEAVADNGSGRDWEMTSRYVPPPGQMQEKQVLKRDMVSDPALKPVGKPVVETIKAPGQPAPVQPVQAQPATSPPIEKRAVIKPKALPDRLEEKPVIR